jgi:hypothetical protein
VFSRWLHSAEKDETQLSQLTMRNWLSLWVSAEVQRWSELREHVETVVQCRATWHEFERRQFHTMNPQTHQPSKLAPPQSAFTLTDICSIYDKMPLTSRFYNILIHHFVSNTDALEVWFDFIPFQELPADCLPAYQQELLQNERGDYVCGFAEAPTGLLDG